MDSVLFRGRSMWSTQEIFEVSTLNGVKAFIDTGSMSKKSPPIPPPQPDVSVVKQAGKALAGHAVELLIS